MSSRVSRWLYWLEAIDKASLADLPRLAALANGDTTATRLVASRWVQLDLRHLFNTLAAGQDRSKVRAWESAELRARDVRWSVTVCLVRLAESGMDVTRARTSAVGSPDA